LGLVFNDHHALGRQSKYLAALHLQALHLAQVSLTVLAALHQVDNHLIGRWREHQSASRVIGLPSGLLAASLAQTLGLTMKAIGGGWQMAVVAVLFQPLLQSLHLLLEQAYLRMQPFDQGLLLVEQRLLLLKQDLLQLDLLLLQADSFPQVLILLSHFFFSRHVATVSDSFLPW
jgi:hypothetical protein